MPACEIGLAIGLCLASGVVAISFLQPADKQFFLGWRIAFILSPPCLHRHVDTFERDGNAEFRRQGEERGDADSIFDC